MTFSNYCELFGAISSLVCVWLNTQGKPQAWYWAIVGGILYAIVFFEAKLYGNFLVQIIFLLLSIYGFWEWHFNQKNQSLDNEIHKDSTSFSPQYFPPKYYFLLLISNIFLLGLLLSVFVFWLGLPFNIMMLLDVVSGVGSITAQYLLAKKYIENWFFWIVVNILVMIITFFSALYLSVGLYFLFLLLAIYGYLEWEKK